MYLYKPTTKLKRSFRAMLTQQIASSYEFIRIVYETLKLQMILTSCNWTQIINKINVSLSQGTRTFVYLCDDNKDSILLTAVSIKINQ
jgi:hypothetical protein